MLISRVFMTRTRLRSCVIQFLPVGPESTGCKEADDQFHIFADRFQLVCREDSKKVGNDVCHEEDRIKNRTFSHGILDRGVLLSG